MPQIEPELKQLLMEQGRWAEFVKFRQDLKKSGLEPIEAHACAMKEFFNNPPAVTDKGRRIPKSRRQSQRNASLSLPQAVSVSEQGSGGPVEPPSGSLSTSLPGAKDSFQGEVSSDTIRSRPEEVPPANAPIPEPTVKMHTMGLPSLPSVRSEDFDGKRASEVEVVRWVADNMQVEDPLPKDCPSAAAWGLLAQCRESLSARSDFWKQTYAKLLPSRAQMEVTQDSGPREGRAAAVIEKLLSFKNEAVSRVESAGYVKLPDPPEEEELGEGEEDGVEVLEEGDRGGEVEEELTQDPSDDFPGFGRSD